MKNSADQGGCYPQRPNTLRDLLAEMINLSISSGAYPIKSAQVKMYIDTCAL